MIPQCSERRAVKFLLACLSAALSVLCCASAWAAPAAPIQLTLVQPDGTTIIAIPQGDEYANWTETADGQSIVKEDDTWYYAELDVYGELIATGVEVGSMKPAELIQMPLHLSPERDPEALLPRVIRKIPRQDVDKHSNAPEAPAISHTQNVLTVLVEYSDQSFTYSDASFQSLIYGASNSVSDFFLDDSYGGFTIVAANESEGIVNDGIIHLTRGIAHPNPGDSFAVSRPEARAIVELTDAFIDYSAYDTNGDNTLSASELSIVIILAGYEASFGGAENALTPNVWGNQASFITALTLDGKALSPYAMFGESHGVELFPPHQATIGIMCHELGHLMLGLPDLYDTDKSSNGIGRWGLMSSGNWNSTGAFSGDSPAHMSAWSKAVTAFTLPTLIETDQSGVNIADAETTEDSKKLWIDKYRWRDYFLIENRQQTGYDAALPGNGLLIWHIDEFKVSNADENHKRVDLEEADGQLHLDLKTNSGDAGDPFPGSSNNTNFNDASTPNSKDYDGNATLIAVSDISASSANMTADLTPLIGSFGGHVRYDENGFNNSLGLGLTSWTGVRALNDTGFSVIDGVDVYVADPAGATLDVSFFTSMAGGTPTGPIYSETGYSAVRGWNRLLFTTPQSFPPAAERGIVVKVMNNNSNFSAMFDSRGVSSGRSYFSTTGTGKFTPICIPNCVDANVVALLSNDDITAPTVITIIPSELGPTNASSVNFDISFSEPVVNFNDAADLTITHSGTAHSGVTITGSGTTYNADVTGITGTGSFTLTVDIGSDVQDAAGNPLASSVTSAAVSIDNAVPEVSIGLPSVNSTTSGPVSYIITYAGADAVTLLAGDITLNQTDTAVGTIGVTGSGTATRTVIISSISGAGTLGISIVPGTASDTAGNSAGAAGPSATFNVGGAELIFKDSFESLP